MSKTVKTIVRTGLCLVLAMGLADCGKSGDKAASSTETKVSYPYDVTVTFTPAAVSALQKAGVGVVVDAYYFGAPAASAKDKVNDDGQIELGQDLVEIDAKDQTVHLTGKGIVANALRAIDGAPSVEVRVYSGTTRANVLSCAPFKDTVQAAQAKPVAITCDVAKAGGEGKKRK